jgi:hypothetical protein
MPINATDFITAYNPSKDLMQFEIEKDGDSEFKTLFIENDSESDTTASKQ